MNQISECISGCNELCTSFLEVIVTHLKLSKVGDVALVTQLDWACLCNLVHIYSKIFKEIEIFWLYNEFESIIANLVNSEIDNFKIRKFFTLSNVLSTFWINLIATQVNLFNMPQIIRGKDILHTFTS